jgi:hypothetical protein
MLSLFSTLGGLLISGLPKLLEYFQDKQDKKHELALARMQGEIQAQMLKEGYLAQQRIEEIRTDQVAMQTDAQMTEAALKHDEKVLDKASIWVANYVGTVRPTITYIFVIELVLINFYLMYWGLNAPGFLVTVQDLIAFSDVIFSSDEMAMLGGVIGYWFGARGWAKK